MRITHVVGARPNFVKLWAVWSALSKRRGLFRQRIVHTGQHENYSMSGVLFNDLGLPAPDVILNAWEASSCISNYVATMVGLDRELTANRPDAVLVYGDVDSTVIGAQTAARLGIRVGHVEAGLRSFDHTMPEEANRIATDSVSEWLFTSEPFAEQNLRREGVRPERSHPVGNVMVDTQMAFLPWARARAFHCTLGLDCRKYAVLTLHRPSNVDNRETFASIMAAVRLVCDTLPVVFPVHPRTRAKAGAPAYWPRSEIGQPGHYGPRTIDPVGYLEMLCLLNFARLVLTDSGGIQEEATALRVPCLTLRDNTERPATCSVGSNRVVGTKTDRIVDAVDRVLAGPQRIGALPELWDGRAGERIADVLAREA